MYSRIALVSLISSIALWSIVNSSKHREQCSTDLINPCHETLQSIRNGLKLSEIRELLMNQVGSLRECRKYNLYGTHYVNTPSIDYSYKPVVTGLYGYKPYVNPGYNPGFNPGYKPGYSHQPSYCKNGICKEIGLLRSADQLTGNDAQTQAPQNTEETFSTVLPPGQSNYTSQSSLGPPIAITLLVYPYTNKDPNNHAPQGAIKIPSTEDQGYFGDFGENGDSDYSVVDYLFPDENEYISEYEPEWTIFDEAMINEFFLLTGLGEFDDINGVSLNRDTVPVNSNQLLQQCSNIPATSYPQLLATIRAMKESGSRKN